MVLSKSFSNPSLSVKFQLILMSSENFQLLLRWKAEQLSGRNVLIDYSIKYLTFASVYVCVMSPESHRVWIRSACFLQNCKLNRDSHMKITFCTCRFSKSSLFQHMLSEIITLKVQILNHLPCKKYWNLEGDEKDGAFVNSSNWI